MPKYDDLALLLAAFSGLIDIVWGTIWRISNHAIFIIFSLPRLLFKKQRQLVFGGLQNIDPENHWIIDDWVTLLTVKAANILALVATFALYIAVFFWANNWHWALTFVVRGFMILSIGLFITFYVWGRIETARAKRGRATLS